MGLLAAPLMVPAVYHGRVTVQDCDYGFIAILNTLGLLKMLTQFDNIRGHRPPDALLFQ